VSQTIRTGVAQPKQHSKRPWLLWLILILAATGYWLIFHSQYFLVTNIKVQGNSRVPSEKISTLAQIAVGQSIAKIPTNEISSALSAIPEIKSVAVERGWPHTVLVNVNERKPIAVANNGKQLVLVDDAGIVASAPISQAPKGMLTVIGAPSSNAMLAAVTVIAGLPKEWKVLEVNASTQDSVVVHLAKGISVTFGSGDDIDQKVKVATALIANKYKEINVSSPDAPTVTK
jgi:cell division protein FtsQ